MSGIVGFMRGVAGVLSRHRSQTQIRQQTVLRVRRTSRGSRATKPRSKKTHRTTTASRNRTVGWGQLRKDLPSVLAIEVALLEAPAFAIEEALFEIPAPQVDISMCPACGLQAPQLLMDEHFLGSPTHQNGPILSELGSAPVMKTESAVGTRVDDTTQGLRSLLQILVPPRAFGRRLQGRTVNPMSGLVQRFVP